MRHTIELSDTSEESLRRLAQSLSSTEDALLRAMTELVLASGSAAKEGGKHDLVLTLGDKKVYIEIQKDLYGSRSSPDVMGGDVCVRNTRVPLWMLVGYKEAGFTDERILSNFPVLNAADLTNAWDFFAANSQLINAERRSHEEAD